MRNTRRNDHPVPVLRDRKVFLRHSVDSAAITSLFAQLQGCPPPNAIFSEFTSGGSVGLIEIDLSCQYMLRSEEQPARLLNLTLDWIKHPKAAGKIENRNNLTFLSLDRSSAPKHLPIQNQTEEWLYTDYVKSRVKSKSYSALKHLHNCTCIL